MRRGLPKRWSVSSKIHQKGGGDGGVSNHILRARASQTSYYGWAAWRPPAWITPQKVKQEIALVQTELREAKPQGGGLTTQMWTLQPDSS